MRALLALLLALAAGACRPSGPRPTVLVIVADSLAAGHVSSYGGARPTTPQFDAFAAGGARFECAYAPAAWTLPSVASLLTSRPQEEHGLRELEGRLDAALPTLAESFRENGYATHAVVQTPVLGSRTGLARGFGSYTVLDFSLASFERALALTEQALASSDERPAFVYLHVAPPHMPYQPPAPFRGRFSATLADSGGVDGSIESARRVHKAGLAPEHPDVQRLAALYDEHVAFVDDALGRLLERLRALPRERPVLVVWTSDHGEAFMEHGQQGHNSSVYEEMLRVPLAIAELDGSLAPRVCAEPVSLLDLAPTLAELCALAPLGGARGSSLAPLLGGTAPARERAIVASSRYYSDHPERLQFAVRRGRHKLVWSAESGRAELFDLERDPRERRDVSGEQPEVARELREVLERARVLRTVHGPAAELAPDAEELRRRAALRELGYTQD